MLFGALGATALENMLLRKPEVHGWEVISAGEGIIWTGERTIATAMSQGEVQL